MLLLSQDKMILTTFVSVEVVEERRRDERDYYCIYAIRSGNAERVCLAVYNTISEAKSQMETLFTSIDCEKELFRFK